MPLRHSRKRTVRLRLFPLEKKGLFGWVDGMVRGPNW